MASNQDLYEIFEAFCSFGSNRNLATGASSTNDLNGPQMDGAKFCKLAKDCKIIGKNVTTTDVDILFNKAKGKGARRLDFQAFQVAFQMLADKKYPDKNPRDAYSSLLHLVSDKGPIARGTVTDTSGIYDKLTNTQLYTGSHKERFDSSGIGKGGAGRQPIDSQTAELHQLVNRNTNAVVPNNTFSSATPNVSGSAAGGAAKKRGQSSVVTASSERLDIGSQAPKRQEARNSNSKLNEPAKVNRSSGNLSKNSNSSLNKSQNSIANKPAAAGNSAGGSVFDRLTNVSGYTGSHAHRFNSDGSGKGMSGRDLPSKGAGTHGQYRGGDVKDLSQILRS